MQRRVSLNDIKVVLLYRLNKFKKNSEPTTAERAFTRVSLLLQDAAPRIDPQTGNLASEDITESAYSALRVLALCHENECLEYFGYEDNLWEISIRLLGVTEKEELPMREERKEEKKQKEEKKTEERREKGRRGNRRRGNH